MRACWPMARPRSGRERISSAYLAPASTSRGSNQVAIHAVVHHFGQPADVASRSRALRKPSLRAPPVRTIPDRSAAETGRPGRAFPERGPACRERTRPSATSSCAPMYSAAPRSGPSPIITSFAGIFCAHERENLDHVGDALHGTKIREVHQNRLAVRRPSRARGRIVGCACNNRN